MKYLYEIFAILFFVLIIGCASMISKKSNTLINDTISIPTAQCNMCVARIENTLNEIKGINKYKVEIKRLEVKVQYDSESISLQQIEQTLSNLGYQANDQPANQDVYNKLPMCCQLPKPK